MWSGEVIGHQLLYLHQDVGEAGTLITLARIPSLMGGLTKVRNKVGLGKLCSKNYLLCYAQKIMQFCYKPSMNMLPCNVVMPTNHYKI